MAIFNAGSRMRGSSSRWTLLSSGFNRRVSRELLVSRFSEAGRLILIVRSFGRETRVDFSTENDRSTTEIDREERLQNGQFGIQNGLFCVERDVKHQPSQSIDRSTLYTASSGHG